MIGRNTFKWQCGENNPTGISGFLIRSVTWIKIGPSSIQVTLLFTDSQITYLIQQLLQQEATLCKVSFKDNNPSWSDLDDISSDGTYRYQLFVLAGSKCDVVSLPNDTRNKHMGHYHRTVQGLNCSVTVAHGPSGKGKTTALLSELSLFGGQKKNLSIQGGPKKASYQFWQGRQFLLA